MMSTLKSADFIVLLAQLVPHMKGLRRIMHKFLDTMRHPVANLCTTTNFYLFILKDIILRQKELWPLEFHNVDLE